jgi:4-amino-4-deoxy-L-arabinose transferase-like glycosyltransferase
MPIRTAPKDLFWPLLVTLAASMVVFWPALGYSGLSLSEGLRAIPGWQMLESRSYLLPRLFEQLYLRKPPGMPWAVAAVSSLLGETEFAARSVGALASTLSALLSAWFAGRWFGRGPAVVAGLGFVLTPLFLYPGRSAEIEGLNDFLCLAAMLGSIHLACDDSTRGFRRGLLVAFVIAASASMMMVKGPAGVPCTLASVFMPYAARGRLREGLRSGCAWLMALAPLALFASYSWLAVHAYVASGESAVTEPPSRFLWNFSRLGSIVFLPLIALASAFPMGLAVPLAIAARPLDETRDRFARAVLLTCLASLLVYAIVGVSNPRYAMPALTLAPMACAILFARVSDGLGAPFRSRRLARHVAWIAAAVLLPVAMGQAAWIEYRREFRTSGREAGRAMAEFLPDGAEVWANTMIDSRPEVLWYAQRAAAAAGRRVRVVWKPFIRSSGEKDPLAIPPSGGFVLIRTDIASGSLSPSELLRYRAAGLADRLGPPLLKGTVHTFDFELHRVP